jgi:hypothetical protein
VLAEPQYIEWDGAPQPCFVIDYRAESGDDFTGRTWVRTSDGLVLRQEARSNEETLVLQRE